MSPSRMISFFRKFKKDQDGVALVEFAMLLPLLMLLAAGSFEVGRYALLTQKRDRIAATVGDLVARAEALTAAEIDNLFNATDFLARPFDFAGDGMVVISSVIGRNGQPPLIIGQRVRGAITGQASHVGALNGNALLPESFTAASGQTLEDGETVIVAEVFYDYSPYMTGDIGLFNNMIFYRNAFFRPRLSETITFN